MTSTEPGIAEVEAAIVELLREQEVGAMAVIAPDGTPLVATMHFASDGLTVYVHTFTYTRKYAALLADGHVAYELDHLSPDGFAGRAEVRSAQVNGIATRVTDRAEIEHAIELSHQQFGWLKDANIYNGFKREGGAKLQVFFRIEPVQALWTDNRVRVQWRKLVTFSADGRSVASLRPYPVGTA